MPSPSKSQISEFPKKKDGKRIKKTLKRSEFLSSKKVLKNLLSILGNKHKLRMKIRPRVMERLF
jgi:hypothetical protein